MSSTNIAAGKTAMEISGLLSRNGAHQILVTYEHGFAIGLSFSILRNGVQIHFRLPIKWEKVMAAMQKDKKTPRHLCNQEQSIRTAWRLILRWVQAQLALVEAGSVDMEEVFLPYAESRHGMTVYELYSESRFKLLEAPK